MMIVNGKQSAYHMLCDWSQNTAAVVYSRVQDGIAVIFTFPASYKIKESSFNLREFKRIVQSFLMEKK
ncbi:hypothetical protein D3C73_1003880 [compost metagenome]